MRYRRFFTSPAVNFFHRIGISPNVVSIVALFLGVLSFFTLWKGMLFFSAVLILFSGYLDIVDGDLARKMKKAGRMGDFLDHFFDRLVDFLIFLGIFFWGGAPAGLVLFAVATTFFVSYLGLASHLFVGKRNYGGFGRYARLATIFFGCIFSQLSIALWVIIILGAYTVARRFWFVYKRL